MVKALALRSRCRCSGYRSLVVVLNAPYYACSHNLRSTVSSGEVAILDLNPIRSAHMTVGIFEFHQQVINRAPQARLYV